MNRLNRSLAVAAILGSLVLVGCDPSAGASGPPPSAPPGGVVLVARGNGFDRSLLAVPAGTAFPLLFENRDGAPHNVRIVGPNGNDIFNGEIFPGPATRTYAVPAIPAGTYRFRCDVHPDMAGELRAG